MYVLGQDQQERLAVTLQELQQLHLCGNPTAALQQLALRCNSWHCVAAAGTALQQLALHRAVLQHAVGGSATRQELQRASLTAAANNKATAATRNTE